MLSSRLVNLRVYCSSVNKFVTSHGAHARSLSGNCYTKSVLSYQLAQAGVKGIFATHVWI